MQIIGTYCEGSRCSKRNVCAKHIKANIPNALYEFIDWSTHGKGSCYQDKDGITRCEITHDCGDQSKTYPLFEPFSFLN